MAFDALLREYPAGAAKHWDAIMKILQVQITGSICGGKDADEEGEGDDTLRQRRTQGEKTTDPELQLAHLLLLETLLRNSFPLLIQQEQKKQVDLHHLLTAILLPVIVWRAGRTAATLRKVGLLCLYRLLRFTAIDKKRLLPILCTTLEDYDAGTRHTSCLCIKLLGEQGDIDETAVVIDNLVKRFNDASNDVRQASVAALESLLSLERSKGHVMQQGVIDALSVFVNDPEIGEAVAKLLEKHT
jgi:hypothetical protein